jgi:hypothetical protein
MGDREWNDGGEGLRGEFTHKSKTRHFSQQIVRYCVAAVAGLPFTR